MIALSSGKMNKTYIIEKIMENKEDLRDFLFTLGCYPGEKITIISELSENYIISLKDARYSINKELADTILV